MGKGNNQSKFPWLEKSSPVLVRESGEEIPLKDALADPSLRKEVEKLLNYKPRDDQWIPTGFELGRLIPWNLLVQVSRMPDGSKSIIGLRIEPWDEYEGSLFDQRITRTLLSNLPLSAWLHDASAQKSLFEDNDPDAWLGHLVDRNIESEASERESRRSARVAEVGEDQVKLEEVVQAYKTARGNLSGPPVRQQVADALGVCVRTVDRRLRKARASGLLERYPGRQGKYGNTQGGTDA